MRLRLQSELLSKVMHTVSLLLAGLLIDVVAVFVTLSRRLFVVLIVVFLGRLLKHILSSIHESGISLSGNARCSGSRVLILQRGGLLGWLVRRLVGEG